GEVESLRNYIENENLSDIVEYVGWVDGQKKNDLLLQCNVLILPSYNEGLPISILEAMSYGKAIIATTVGGIPEIVSDNENGFLFTPGDKETLAFLIKKFTTDPELIKRLGDVSLKKVQPYLIDNVIKQLEVIYKSIT